MEAEKFEDIILDHLPVPIKRALRATGSMYYVRYAADAIAAAAEADKADALAELQAENERLREVVKDLTLACVEAAATLELVDPNAASLEQADAAIGKHIKYTGPILREEARAKE